MKAILLSTPEGWQQNRAGELLHLPRQTARWEWMSFDVRRLSPGDEYRAIPAVTSLWLKVLIEKDVAIDPGYLEWAGVGVFNGVSQLRNGNRIVPQTRGVVCVIS